MLNAVTGFFVGVLKNLVLQYRLLATSQYSVSARKSSSPPVVLRAVINKARGTNSLLLKAAGCFVYYIKPPWIEYRVIQADVSVGNVCFFFCRTVSASYFTISPEPNPGLLRLKYIYVLTEVTFPNVLHNASGFVPGTAGCPG